jgi:hypothetical protein
MLCNVQLIINNIYLFNLASLLSLNQAKKNGSHKLIGHVRVVDLCTAARQPLAERKPQAEASERQPNLAPR